MPDQALSESIGAELVHEVETVHQLLSDAAHLHGDKLAMVCMHQPADHLGVNPKHRSKPYLQWSFTEIQETSRRCANALWSSGIRPGMRIAAYIANNIEYHIWFRAALALNCPFAPINPKAATSVDEMRNVIDVTRPSVLVAQDRSIAHQFSTRCLDSDSMLQVLLVLDDDDKAAPLPRGWRPFAEYLAASDPECSFNPDSVSRSKEDVILVLMTSGTTSLPKGCPHTNVSFMVFMNGYRHFIQSRKERTLCAHLAVSHIFGAWPPLAFNVDGRPAVHPAAFFDPNTTMKAFLEEGCTDVCAVPAMVDTLSRHPDQPKLDRSKLKYIVIGGSAVTEAVFKSATETLGFDQAGDAYGMTEGAPAIASSEDLSGPRSMEHMLRTRVCPGAAARVCDRETGAVLPRGELGEVHLGGPIVINEYWTGSRPEDTSSFYTDALGTWVRTGDEGVMSDNGSVSITGRYKHQIIRGGENISPKRIENAIASHFGIENDVVGAKDDAGEELPVAVVKGLEASHVTPSDIKEYTVKALGPAYGVQAVIDVQDLGLDSFPMTASGKVQKHVLSNLVEKRLRQSSRDETPDESGPATPDASGSVDGLAEQLAGLWNETLGLSNIRTDTNIREWADSLVIARFPNLVKKRTGLEVRSQDIQANTTPFLQAKALGGQKGSQGEVEEAAVFPLAHGPPKASEMIHARGRQSVEEETRRACEAALQPLGLGWEDVRQVTPLYSFQESFLRQPRSISNTNRQTFLVQGRSVQETRTALEAALATHDLLRTFSVRLKDETALHVSVRPCEEWFAQMIFEVPPFETKSHFETFEPDDLLFAKSASKALVRFVIGHVQDEGCTGVHAVIQHSTFDAVYLAVFQQDLDDILAEPAIKLPARIPFKAWIDSEYSLRSSLGATTSIDWNVRRLKGLKAKEDALFPVQKAAEFFKGDSRGWRDLNTGEAGAERPSHDNHGDGSQGLAKTCSLTHAHELRLQHGVDAPFILKAAVSILNARRNRHRCALFGQYQAARTWPHLPSWQTSRLPPAVDVMGPTFQFVVLAIDIDEQEPVSSLLQRLQAEQDDLNAHSHAPFAQVIQALGPEDGPVMADIHRRQIFNWLPASSGPDTKVLKSRGLWSRTDNGVLWNCVQQAQDTVRAMVRWDGAQLTTPEARSLLDEMVEIAEALATPETWTQPCGRFFAEAKS